MLGALTPFLLNSVSAFNIPMLPRGLIYLLTCHPHTLRDLPPMGSVSYLSPILVLPPMNVYIVGPEHTTDHN